VLTGTCSLSFLDKGKANKRKEKKEERTKGVLLTTTFFIFLFSFFIFNLPAQSAAEEIEVLLGTGAVTYAQAARFILEASDTFITSDQNEAFRYASERKWLPGKTQADKPARLDALSLLFMQSFEIRGGLFYSIFKNPRYAYREMVYRNFIHGRIDPAMNVTGERLLFYTGRVLTYSDREAAVAAERVQRRQEAEESRITGQSVMERRTRLAEEISALLTEQDISDTTVKATDEGIMITLSDIQFLADSAVLPEFELVKLQEIANIFMQIKGIKLLVTGHTALAGSEEGRLRISQERAQAVADYLIKLGACDEANITVAGYGADRPVADNSSEAGRAANRRVEITILEN
jgi:outer membrane protein OmpA-like peptidoglycan-associated protein